MNYNFSIWFVQLTGIDEREYIRPKLKWFNNVSFVLAVFDNK